MPPLAIPVSSDPNQRITAFLESIKNESYGPILADIHSFLLTCKDHDDTFLRRQKNRVQKHLQEEYEVYEKLTSECITNLQNGFRLRVQELAENEFQNGAERVKYLEAVDNWVLTELEGYQTQLKARKRHMVISLGKVDKDSFGVHRATLLCNEENLLNLFVKLKRRQVSFKAYENGMCYLLMEV
jgi:hypothetical protein